MSFPSDSERQKPAPLPAPELLAAVVASTEDAIVTKDLSSIITSWNPAAERIFGYTAAEAIGQSVLMLIPSDRQDEETKILSRIGRGERVEHFETIRLRKCGEAFHVSLTISPVRDAAGKIIGASKIARDITELRRLSDEREQSLANERAARAQAERANRMKDDFLATVSHELRTPLNAIIGWTEVLKESGRLDPEDRHGLETIEKNAKVQAQLIDDLLDLGRIVSGKMALDVERFDLANVVNDAVSAVHLAASAKGITIQKVLDSRPTWTVGDQKRLQQAVWNLLSNAIKFSSKGSSVVIALRRVNSHMEVSVADHGRGITPEFLPHVFERFRQADASTTRQFGGLGIGLAIVKQLVEMHGGQVWVESPGEGKGATFTFSIPVVATSAAAAVKPLMAALADGEPVVAVRPELKGTKVLVVDDDVDSLEVVAKILRSRQAEVATATTMEQALSLFPQFRPDIVLSDIGMPSHDGYELMRRLRAMPGGKCVPAVALTALARSEDRMHALEVGYQTHVSKPASPSELVAVIRSLLSLVPPSA